MLTCDMARLIRCEISEEPLDSFLIRTTSPYRVERKYDGDFCAIEITQEGYITIANRGSTEYDMQWLKQAVAEAFHGRQILALAEIIYDQGKQNQLYKLRTELVNGDHNINLIIFDLLELDGEDLRNKWLRDRLKLLRQAVDLKRSTHVKLAFGINTMSKGDIETFYKETIRKDYEGVVVKSLTSAYADNVWLKIKARNTCDCTLLGIVKTNVFNETGVAHSLLIGFFNQSTGTYDEFGKVGAWENGTLEDWATLTSILKATATHETKDVLYVRPTCVAEIAFEAKLDNSLRGPRIIRLRVDKTPRD